MVMSCFPLRGQRKLLQAPDAAGILLWNSHQSLLRQVSCSGLAGENKFCPLCANFREADGFAGKRFRSAGIRIAKENALHRMGRRRARLGVMAGDGHEHWMATAVDAHFHGVHVEFGKQLLKIGEDSGAEGLAVIFVKKRGALELAQWRVKRKNVVCLLVAGIASSAIFSRTLIFIISSRNFLKLSRTSFG